MSFARRLVLCCAVFIVAVSAAGCVTVQNSLRPEEPKTFKLTGVTVSYAKEAGIAWDDPYRAYAAAKAIPDDQLAIATNTPEAKAFAQNFLAPRIKAAAERHLSPLLAGTRPVRLEIVVYSFHIASAIQRVVIGGGFIMIADANLVDARTGATIVAYPKLVGAATAGQGILGTVVQVAYDAGQGVSEADRLMNNYVEQYANWLLKKLAIRGSDIATGVIADADGGQGLCSPGKPES